MKNDKPDMRDEYDFANARPLRYARTMTAAEREEILRRSAVFDAQFWFAHALQQVQELEATLYAFLSLALHRSPETAQEEAAAVLEGKDQPVINLLTSHMESLLSPRSEFDERLRRLMGERNWLVHKGGFALGPNATNWEALAPLVSRFEAVATHAATLSADLQDALQRRLAQTGVPAVEAQRRADEAKHRWLAA